MKQRQVPIVAAFVISLALIVYGGYMFLDIKAGYHRTETINHQSVNQLELSKHQPIANEPDWTLVTQTAALDIPARNQVKVRISPDLSALACHLSAKSGQFFIAGIIVD